MKHENWILSYFPNTSIRTEFDALHKLYTRVPLSYVTSIWNVFCLYYFFYV